jgi:hypothetical protein
METVRFSETKEQIYYPVLHNKKIQWRYSPKGPWPTELHNNPQKNY